MNIKTISTGILSLFIALSANAQISDPLPPSEVENVTAIHQGDKVDITWSESTDQDGVITGYKIYYGPNSVTSAGEIYENEIVVGNNPSYSLDEGIDPSTTYYIAVTAIDDEELESENFSIEVMAAPENQINEPLAAEIPSENSDTTSPTPIKAEYPNLGTIIVTFSEPIKIEEPDAAFTIIEKTSQKYININSVTASGSQAIISVNPEDINTEESYSVTASYWVTDLAGNPISSGITDSVDLVVTQSFGGLCEDMTCFIEGVENNVESDVPVAFSINYFDLVNIDYQGVFSFYTPEGNTTPAIQIKIDESNSSLEESVNIGLGAINLCQYDNLNNLTTFLQSVEQGKSDASLLFNAFTQCDVYNENAVFEETTRMGPEGLELVRSLVDFLLEINTEVEDVSSDPFNSAPPALETVIVDTIAPLDVTSLEIDTSMLQDTNSVTLSWIPALDSDEDITDQMLYIRESGKNYGEGTSLGKELSQTVLDVKGGKNYEVKIVTIDLSGNESFGRVTTFSTGLNKSGGGMEIIWLIIGIAATVFFVQRRNA